MYYNTVLQYCIKILYYNTVLQYCIAILYYNTVLHYCNTITVLQYCITILYYITITYNIVQFDNKAEIISIKEHTFDGGHMLMRSDLALCSYFGLFLKTVLNSVDRLLQKNDKSEQ